MYLTKKEHLRNTTVSILITVSVFSTLLLYFIFQNLIKPCPHFHLNKKSSYPEITFACYDQNNAQVKDEQMGIAVDVFSENERLISEDNGMNISNKISTTDKLSLVEQLSLKYKLNSVKANEESNVAIGPQNLPLADDTYNSIEKKSNGKHLAFYCDVKGSELIHMPDLPKDMHEEGKVVVNIVVDENGTVIEAAANGRGTTTASAILKAKARQASLATKFNPDKKNPYRRGSITIIFAFD